MLRISSCSAAFATASCTEANCGSRSGLGAPQPHMTRLPRRKRHPGHPPSCRRSSRRASAPSARRRTSAARLNAALHSGRPAPGPPANGCLSLVNPCVSSPSFLLGARNITPFDVEAVARRPCAPSQELFRGNGASRGHTRTGGEPRLFSERSYGSERCCRFGGETLPQPSGTIMRHSERTPALFRALSLGLTAAVLPRPSSKHRAG